MFVKIRPVVIVSLLVFVMLSPLVFLGCDEFIDLLQDPSDHPTPPAIAEIVGSYRAETFTTQAEGDTTDWLVQGASIQISLNPDGVTDGRLFIPEVEEDGSDFDVSLSGTWSLSARTHTVTFEHAADTFLRDMEFTVNKNQLDGEQAFGDLTVRVTLTKER